MIKGYGCPKCAYIKIADAQRKPHEQFVAELAIVNPKILILGGYLNSQSKIECKCIDCGHKWSATPANLLCGHGCPICAKTQTSFAEKAILLFLQHVLGKDDVVSRDRSMIGKEIDVYIKSLNTGIEFGGWYWHKSRIKKDKEKHSLCRKKGMGLITIYDNFDGDRKKLELNDSFITYPYGLGVIERRSELKGCIKNIFNLLNLTYAFTEDDERKLFFDAKMMVRRKTTEDVVCELAAINPDIELIGQYEDATTKMPCRCKLCGHEWDVSFHHLVNQRRGCPMCNRKHKKVVNLDTGETFESVSEASRKLSVSRSSIGYACADIKHTCKGNHFAYLQDLSHSTIK
jgi:hypothetical protein